MVTATNKKSAKVIGRLGRPLEVGDTACLIINDRIIGTSSVVAIYSVASNQVCFETQNTVYTLCSANYSASVL